MFKRLITWLHARYCEPEELSGAELVAAEKNYQTTMLLAEPFVVAAREGLDKPPYPLLNDNELGGPGKRALDAIYANSRPKDSALFNRVRGTQ